MENEKQYTVYIVRCSDNTLYTGITTDIHRRVSEHNGTTPKAGVISQQDKGAVYTSLRRPVRLVYTQGALGRSDATRQERLIKRLSKMKKEQMVVQWLLIDSLNSSV
jgi:putative endonuclease